MVLVTMGGVRWDYTFVPRLAAFAPVHFVIPGAVDVAERHDNTLLLPANLPPWYHPDLVHASDGVIFGRYVEVRMPGLRLSGPRFASGEWLSQLPELLVLPRRTAPAANGAAQVATYVPNLGLPGGRLAAV